MSIQERRRAMGWSQEDLAACSGLSVRTIQRIETGKMPSLETRRSLAAAFDIPLAELQSQPAAPAADEYAEHLWGLIVHLCIFGFFSVALGALNLVISPGVYWVHYVVIAWAAALAFQAMIFVLVYQIPAVRGARGVGPSQG